MSFWDSYHEKIKERPILAQVLVSALFIFSSNAFCNMDFEISKKTIFPGVNIRLNYSGADAFKIEEVITDPIEDIISSVGGIKKIFSITESGKVNIQVKFAPNTDIPVKSMEIREKLDLISHSFPRDAHKPIVTRYDPDQVPVIIVSLHSDKFELDDLRNYAEKIFKSDLEGIDGVSQVIIAGGNIKELLVACDPEKLEAYSLGIRDILNIIQDNNQNTSLGSIKSILLENSILSIGKFNNIYDLQNLVIATDIFQNAIYLKDVAEISFESRDQDVGSRINGIEKVSIFIYKNFSGNPISISEESKRILNRSIAKDIDIVLSQDLGEKYKSVIMSLIFLYFLIIIICLYLSRFLKYRLIVVFTFISSTVFAYSVGLIFAFLFRREYGIYFHYSFYFAIIFWFLSVLRKYRIRIKLIPEKQKHDIVNSIFILKFKERYKYKYLFFVNLMLSIAVYVVDPDLGQSFFLFFIFVLIFFLSMSFVFPIIFDVLSYGYEKAKFFDLRLSITQLEEKYFKLCYKTLSSNWNGIWKLGKLNIYLTPFIIIGSIGLGFYYYFNLGNRSVSNLEKNEITVFIELPSGSSYEHTSKVTLEVEKKIIELKEIENVVTKVDPGHSLVIIQLVSGIYNNSELQNKIKNHVGTIKDEYIYFVSDQENDINNELTFDVFGKDIYELEEMVIRLSNEAKSLKGVNESVLRFKPAREEMQLLLDSYKFNQSEIKFPEFSDQLKLAIQGGVASKFIKDDREMDIRIRYASDFRSSVDKLESIRIKNDLSRFVPILEVVHQRVGKVPLKIYHRDKERTLSFTVKMDGNSKTPIDDVIKYFKSTDLPEGYRVDLQDSHRFRTNWYNGLLFFLVIAGNVTTILVTTESISKALKIIRIITFPSLLYFIVVSFILHEASYDYIIIAWVLGIAFSVFAYQEGLIRSNYLTFSLFILCFGCALGVENSVVGFYHILAGVFVYYLLFVWVSLSQKKPEI